MKFYGFATALTVKEPRYLDITCTALFVEESNRHHRTLLPELSIEQNHVDTKDPKAMTEAVNNTIRAYNTVFDLQQNENETDPPPLLAIVGKSAAIDYPTADIRKTFLEYAVPTENMSEESINLRHHFAKALQGSRLCLSNFVPPSSNKGTQNKNAAMTTAMKNIASVIPLFNSPNKPKEAADIFDEQINTIAYEVLNNAMGTVYGATAQWFDNFGFPTLENILKNTHHELSAQEITLWDQIIHDAVINKFKKYIQVVSSQINSRGNFCVKRDGEKRGRYFEDLLIPLIWDRIDIYRKQPEAIYPKLPGQEERLNTDSPMAKPHVKDPLTEKDVVSRYVRSYRQTIIAQIEASPQ